MTIGGDEYWKVREDGIIGFSVAVLMSWIGCLIVMVIYIAHFIYKLTTKS